MGYIKQIGFFIFILILSQLSYAECPSNDAEVNKIKQSIKTIVSCWNQSDANCALNQFYGNDAIYIAKTGPIFGKTNVVKHFTDMLRDEKTGKINLGTLKLNLLYCKKIDNTHILTLQEFHFRANKSAPLLQGYDTLIWEKINDHWLITYDHPRDK